MCCAFCCISPLTCSAMMVSKSRGSPLRPACCGAALLGPCALPKAVLPVCSDNNLIAFNRKLQGYNYDLTSWRRAQQKRGSKELQEGFQASCAVLMSMLLGDMLQKRHATQAVPAALCLSRLLEVGLGGMLQRLGRKWADCDSDSLPFPLPESASTECSRRSSLLLLILPLCPAGGLHGMHAP